jgi:CRP/FNR family transcriptional regulator
MVSNHSDILELFPALKQLNPSERERLLQEARVLSYPADTRLYHENQDCTRYLLVLKGSLRVQKLTDNGHEIVLYHVGPGQSCRLTNSCLLGGQRYPAEAYTETEVELLSVPKAAFRQLLDKSSALREEIFTSIDDAMGDLVRLVEDIAFGQLDHRLAQFLLSHARQQSRLEITHQELATELGTAREVISRLLKEFERNGWVKLHRGSVEINERESLAGI